MAAKKPEAQIGKPDEAIFTLEADELPEAVAALCFPDGDYAYDAKIGKKKYGKQLKDLQIELVKLQRWVRENEQRVVMVFEGRDAAGKGGTIKRFTQYLNPRHARVVALSKPSDVEQGSGISSAMSHTCRRKGTWRCLTGPGTTAAVLSG